MTQTEVLQHPLYRGAFISLCDLTHLFQRVSDLKITRNSFTAGLLRIGRKPVYCHCKRLRGEVQFLDRRYSPRPGQNKPVEPGKFRRRRLESG
jgi:hypothetical protein